MSTTKRHIMVEPQIINSNIPPLPLNYSNWGFPSNATSISRPISPTPSYYQDVRVGTLAVVGFGGVLIFACFVLSMVSNNERIAHLFGEDDSQETRLQLEFTRKVEDGVLSPEEQNSLGFTFRQV